MTNIQACEKLIYDANDWYCGLGEYTWSLTHRGIARYIIKTSIQYHNTYFILQKLGPIGSSSYLLSRVDLLPFYVRSLLSI